MTQPKDNLPKVTEIELIYVNKLNNLDRPLIKSSQSAYDVLLDNWDKGKLELQEQFKIMLLDNKNSCLGISTMATGGITGCVVDVRLAFAAALKARATGMILAHNHPSGNIKASDADKSLTKKFREIGKVIDISILDHIVVTRTGYLSLADEGLLI